MSCLLLFIDVSSSGHFLQSWAIGCIVSVYKKYDKNDFNNYIGSTIKTLFTSIVNEILLKFDERNVIANALFGFRKRMSSIDAIFVLQSVINRTLNQKKR